MKESKIIVTEANIIDVYKHLANKKSLSEEEIKQAVQRFRELAGMEQKGDRE